MVQESPRRVQLARTERAYEGAVITAGSSDSFPLLAGRYQPPLQALAHAYGLDGLTVTTAGEAASHPDRADPRAAYEAGMSACGAEPSDALVVGIGRGAAAAACHALSRKARLAIVSDAGELDTALGACPQPRSLTVVGLGECFDPAGMRRLHQSAEAASVPWGVLTGSSLAALSWVVFKRWLADGHTFGRHVLLHPGAVPPAPAAPSPAIAGRYGAEITASLLAQLTTVPHDLVTVTGHGDQADAHAHAGRLCSRTHARPAELVDATGGLGLMRCFAEEGCYRNRISADADRIPADDLVLVPGDQIRATTVFLNTCGSLLIAPGYRYDPQSSLLRACLDGTPVSVVVAQTPRRSDPEETVLLAGLLWTGCTLGEATRYLNSMQDQYFTSAPVFALFGDPDLAVPGVDPGDPHDPVAADTNGTLLVNAADRPAVRLRVPPVPAGLADGDGGVQVSGSAGSRAFILPGRDGRELLLVNDRGPVGDAEVSYRPAGRPVPVGPYRLLQRRLASLDAVSCPLSGPDRQRLAAATAEVLRTAHLAPAAAGRAGRQERALSLIHRELLISQQAAVRAWTESWNAALGGEMLSLREDRALYGPYQARDESCPNCHSPLYHVPIQDAYRPDSARQLWLCPSCTVVSDLPESSPPLLVDAADRVVRGRPYPLSVRLPAPADEPGAAVLGAAILGARGCCRPAVVPLPARKPDEDIALTIWVGEDMVPGSYSLRVVAMDDLNCLFHLQPVSVLAR